ncbi:MAG: DUF5076 domain-containing protein [Planctomycetaceae bacterium]
MQRQLPVPPTAAGDVRAIELVRVWAAHGKQHVSLATSIWQDPAAWGIMLVDLAKHIANAYEQNEEMDYVNVLSRIREGFDAEWGTSTDGPTEGGLD